MRTINRETAFWLALLQRGGGWGGSQYSSDFGGGVRAIQHILFAGFLLFTKSSHLHERF